MSPNSYYFGVYKDAAGQWRWRFKAPNGKIMADSSESYWNKADCVSAIQTLKAQAPAASVYDE